MPASRRVSEALGARLSTRSESPFWVISVGCAALPAFPLYPLKADIRMIAGVCRRGPIPDSCIAAIASLLDHLVGLRQHCLGNGQTQCFLDERFPSTSGGVRHQVYGRPERVLARPTRVAGKKFVERYRRSVKLAKLASRLFPISSRQTTAGPSPKRYSATAQ